MRVILGLKDCSVSGTPYPYLHEYDDDMNLHIPKIKSVENQRDRLCTDLIEDVTNVDYKLNKLSKRNDEIRIRETRKKSQM